MPERKVGNIEVEKVTKYSESHECFYGYYTKDTQIITKFKKKILKEVLRTDLVAALGNPDIQETQVSKASVP